MTASTASFRLPINALLNCAIITKSLRKVQSLEDSVGLRPREADFSVPLVSRTSTRWSSSGGSSPASRGLDGRRNASPW